MHAPKNTTESISPFCFIGGKAGDFTGAGETEVIKMVANRP